MSFVDKITTIITRLGQEPVRKDGVPLCMRYFGRTMGALAGFIAIFLGAWNCVGIVMGDIGCVISGIWQISTGFIAVCVETPGCCLFINDVQSLSDWVEKRPYWNRALAYVVLAIPAIVMCLTMQSIIGGGLIFLTGAIYGIMELLTKCRGSSQDMEAMASPQLPTTPTDLGDHVDQRPILIEGSYV